MKHVSIATVTAGIAALAIGWLGIPAVTWAQGSPDPARAPWHMMHDWGWGWGGMWLMPLFMLAWFALMIAVIIFLVRWLAGGNGGRSASTRTARDILDERYARGEIDREDYVQRRNDIAGA